MRKDPTQARLPRWRFGLVSIFAEFQENALSIYQPISPGKLSCLSRFGKIRESVGNRGGFLDGLGTGELDNHTRETTSGVLKGLRAALVSRENHLC